MRTLPIRLQPGDDLRRALEAALRVQSCAAAFVLSGIGSLVETRLRMAGEEAPRQLVEPVEILTLAGSIGPDGSHLHAAVSDAQGRVTGGHVAYGCIVRTTAEVLLALLDDWAFAREPDASTGYAELAIRPAPTRVPDEPQA